MKRLCGGVGGFVSVYEQYTFVHQTAQGCYDPQRSIWYQAVAVQVENFYDTYRGSAFELEWHLHATSINSGEPLFPYHRPLDGMHLGLQYDLDNSRIVSFMLPDWGTKPPTEWWAPSIRSYVVSYRDLQVVVDEEPVTFFFNDTGVVPFFLSTGLSAYDPLFDIYYMTMPSVPKVLGVDDPRFYTTRLHGVSLRQNDDLLGGIVLDHEVVVLEVNAQSHELFALLKKRGNEGRTGSFYYVRLGQAMELPELDANGLRDVAFEWTFGDPIEDHVVNPAAQDEILNDKMFQIGATAIDHLTGTCYVVLKEAVNESGPSYVHGIQPPGAPEPLDYTPLQVPGMWLVNTDPVLGIPAQLPAPKLEDARFTLDGGSIIVRFDVSTTEGANPVDLDGDGLPEGVDWTTQQTGMRNCSDMFTRATFEILGPMPQSECEWINSSAIQIHVSARDTLVNITTPVFLKDTTIYAFAPEDSRLSTPATGGVPVLMPSPLYAPEVVAYWNEVVNHTAGATIDTSDSYWHGGRPVWVWALSDVNCIETTYYGPSKQVRQVAKHPKQDVISRIRDILDMASAKGELNDRPKGDAFIEFGDAELEPGCTYNFLVNLTGRWLLSSTMYIELTKEEIPPVVVGFYVLDASVTFTASDPEQLLAEFRSLERGPLRRALEEGVRNAVGNEVGEEVEISALSADGFSPDSEMRMDFKIQVPVTEDMLATTTLTSTRSGGPTTATTTTTTATTTTQVTNSSTTTSTTIRRLISFGDDPRHIGETALSEAAVLKQGVWPSATVTEEPQVETMPVRARLTSRSPTRLPNAGSVRASATVARTTTTTTTMGSTTTTADAAAAGGASPGAEADAVRGRYSARIFGAAPRHLQDEDSQSGDSLPPETVQSYLDALEANLPTSLSAALLNVTIVTINDVAVLDVVGFWSWDVIATTTTTTTTTTTLAEARYLPVGEKDTAIFAGGVSLTTVFLLILLVFCCMCLWAHRKRRPFSSGSARLPVISKSAIATYKMQRNQVRGTSRDVVVWDLSRSQCDGYFGSESGAGVGSLDDDDSEEADRVRNPQDGEGSEEGFPAILRDNESDMGPMSEHSIHDIADVVRSIFPDESHVEYFSGTWMHWIPGKLRVVYLGTTDNPRVRYDVTVDTGFRGQMRLDVPLNSFRLAMLYGDPVEVYSRTKRVWVPATIADDDSNRLPIKGYEVLFQDSGHTRLVSRERVRRRYDHGQDVLVYQGPRLGYVAGVVDRKTTGAEMMVNLNSTSLFPDSASGERSPRIEMGSPREATEMSPRSEADEGPASKRRPSTAAIKRGRSSESMGSRASGRVSAGVENPAPGAFDSQDENEDAALPQWTMVPVRFLRGDDQFRLVPSYNVSLQENVNQFVI